MDLIRSEQFAVAKGDFSVAGEASSSIKRALKKLGVNSAVIRMIAVAAYEAELNMVIHSYGGDLILEVYANEIKLISRDCGPGIPSIRQAMQEGWSTAPESIRVMGFGAGMGLPNIKRNSHEFSISSEVGKGTEIIAKYNI